MWPASRRAGRRSTTALWVCLLCLWPASAEAFQGRLIDRSTRRPIAGAEVGIAGLAGTVRTGPDGGFRWSPDPPLPFVVIIILPDGRLARPVRIVTAGGTGPLDIPVEATLVETIVISGSAPSVDAPPGTATTLVSSLDIGRRAPANLMQALDTIIGVSSVAEGQSAVPAIRGLARGRTLVLLDGSRLFSERRAGPSVSFLAPETLDRVDVVRGPASVAYGSDAFGGVISLITRQPAIAAPFDARLTATMGAGVPAERVEAQVATGLGAHAGLVLQARHRQADDYSSPAGVVPNSTWRDRGALVRLGVRAGGWWTAGWQGDFVRDSGLPRSDSATLLVSTPFERSRRASVSFDRSGVPGVGQVSVTGLFGRYAQRLDQDRLPAPGRPRRIDRANISGTDVEFRVVTRAGLRTARLTTGADFNARRDLQAHDIAIVFNAAGAVTSTTDTPSIASARKRDVGAFVQLDMPVAPRVTTTVGARFNHVRSVNAGGFFGNRAVSQGAASGSAALSIRLWSSLRLTAQASSGFRDPTLSDRFFRGPVGRGFIVGNPDLAPERSRQFEVGARYDTGRWRVSAAYYHYEVADLIERFQSDADTFLFRNRGLAQIRGIEIETGVATSHGLSVELSGQTGRGRAEENDAALDDIAPARILFQMRQAIGTRAFVSARVSASARDSAPGPSEVATPGFVDAGATASWRIGRWLDLRVASANLLNRRYFSSSSSRGVLAPGRNATITVVLKFRQGS